MREVEMQRFRYPGMAALAMICAAPTFEPAKAAVITQAPCSVGPSGACVQFQQSSEILPLRSLSIVVRRPGNYLVTFHGALYCGSEVNGFRVVDLATQIADKKFEAANITRPSGLRHVAVFYNATEGVSFNLSSTRVFRFRKRGRQTVYFNLGQLRLDQNVTCFAYNLTFTVVPPSL